jgi:hypothetical protein
VLSLLLTLVLTILRLGTISGLGSSYYFAMKLGTLGMYHIDGMTNVYEFLESAGPSALDTSISSCISTDYCVHCNSVYTPSNDVPFTMWKHKCSSGPKMFTPDSGLITGYRLSEPLIPTAFTYTTSPAIPHEWYFEGAISEISKNFLIYSIPGLGYCWISSRGIISDVETPGGLCTTNTGMCYWVRKETTYATGSVYTTEIGCGDFDNHPSSFVTVSSAGNIDWGSISTSPSSCSISVDGATKTMACSFPSAPPGSYPIGMKSLSSFPPVPTVFTTTTIPINSTEAETKSALCNCPWVPGRTSTCRTSAGCIACTGDPSEYVCGSEFSSGLPTSSLCSGCPFGTYGQCISLSGCVGMTDTFECPSGSTRCDVSYNPSVPVAGIGLGISATFSDVVSSLGASSFMHTSGFVTTTTTSLTAYLIDGVHCTPVTPLTETSSPIVLEVPRYLDPAGPGIRLDMASLTNWCESATVFTECDPSSPTPRMNLCTWDSVKGCVLKTINERDYTSGTLLSSTHADMYPSCFTWVSRTFSLFIHFDYSHARFVDYPRFVCILSHIFFMLFGYSHARFVDYIVFLLFIVPLPLRFVNYPRFVFLVSMYLFVLISAVSRYLESTLYRTV